MLSFRIWSYVYLYNYQFSYQLTNIAYWNIVGKIRRLLFDLERTCLQSCVDYAKELDVYIQWRPMYAHSNIRTYTYIKVLYVVYKIYNSRRWFYVYFKLLLLCYIKYYYRNIVKFFIVFLVLYYICVRMVMKLE